MILLKNVIYLKKNVKYFLEFKMKKRVLFYKNFKSELCVVVVKKLPFWKRIIYRKKFDIKFFNSYNLLNTE